jgi:hypothetical protein
MRSREPGRELAARISASRANEGKESLVDWSLAGLSVSEMSYIEMLKNQFTDSSNFMRFFAGEAT